MTLLKRGTALPAKKAGYFDNTEPVQNRVYRSLKLWSMYADLEESFGTFKVPLVSNSHQIVAVAFTLMGIFVLSVANFDIKLSNIIGTLPA